MLSALTPSALPGLPGWSLSFFIFALSGTWLARRYALGRLMDQPGERRSHRVPTPRGGGIAIVGAVLCAIVWLAAGAAEQRLPLSLVALGTALVAGIGWIDDHRPLSPWLRLAVHAAASALLAAALLRVGAGPVSAGIAFVLAMALTNVWNFMDGIDGIATTQAAIVALAIAGLAGAGIAGWIAIGLAAACLGFLPFNFPRARIFLGDVGSGALGYLLAALAAWSAISWQDWLLLCLPMSAFLVDAGLTLAARMVRGEAWWTPHVQHVYQRLSRRWRSHVAVTVLYCGWAILGVAIMLRVRSGSLGTIMSAFVGWHLLGAGAWAVARRVDRMSMRGEIE